jgi:hypothetical protein
MLEFVGEVDTGYLEEADVRITLSGKGQLKIVSHACVDNISGGEERICIEASCSIVQCLNDVLLTGRYVVFPILHVELGEV